MDEAKIAKFIYENLLIICLIGAPLLLLMTFKIIDVIFHVIERIIDAALPAIVRATKSAIRTLPKVLLIVWATSPFIVLGILIVGGIVDISNRLYNAISNDLVNWNKIGELAAMVLFVFVAGYACIKLLGALLRWLERAHPDLFDFLADLWLLFLRGIGWVLIGLFVLGGIIAIHETFNGDRDCEYAVGNSGLICE